ncbi:MULTISPECIES: hypothetical protein [Bacillus]|uniref:Uncharacterized protein n=4 Tax=Bacillus TaxID=1386 RepID=A0A0B5S5L8_BACMY|nr:MULTISPECIES: hypothetical protein [Bacillus]RAN86819.1 hypothetical protein B5P41_27140 [Bacillus sp. SRB_28]ABY44202.1 conserved hypothetical protein [Bacillus mycoides KBAB4]AJH22345.1 hypothetical protein BG05_2720 [Bacillus mycoides]EEL96480.1 hypothetical protein bmyco0001_51050 [Bacillus mycoides DSM 2048]EJQ00228.1 hypothetical protein IC3_00127 [Bacillus cereus VD142]
MKKLATIALTVALALGGLTVMNINTPEAQASEDCHYICGPSETVNGVTVQVHATEYTFGGNVIARITNNRAEDIHYNVSIEKKYGDNWGEYDTFFHWQNQWVPAGANDEISTFTGYGENIYDNGTYRYKVEIVSADGSVDTIYTAAMTVTGR